MKVVRYKPLNELDFFTNSFNHLFNDSFFKNRTNNLEKKESWYPAVDILNEKDHVILNVELPGMQKEDITINIENKELSISGKRKPENDEKKDTYYRKEIRSGSFKRSFSLSDDVLTDDVNADFKNGMLKITLRKDVSKEEVKKITIN